MRCHARPVPRLLPTHAPINPYFACAAATTGPLIAYFIYQVGYVVVLVVPVVVCHPPQHFILRAAAFLVGRHASWREARDRAFAHACCDLPCLFGCASMSLMEQLSQVVALDVLDLCSKSREYNVNDCSLAGTAALMACGTCMLCVES